MSSRALAVIVVIAAASSAALAERLAEELSFSYQPDAGPSYTGLLANATPYARMGASLGWTSDVNATGGQPGASPLTDFDNIWGVNFAWGLDWGALLGDPRADDGFQLRARTDVEIAFDAFFYDGFPAPAGFVDSSDGVMTAWMGTLNSWLDLEIPGPVSFFAGAGVGPALLTIDEDTFDASDESAVVQWMAGASIELEQNLDFYAMFRQRFFLNDANFEGVKLRSIEYQAVELGFKIEF